MMLKITIFCLLLSVITAELWERDMSEEIYIEASHEGFQQVKLSCEERRMVVDFLLDEDHDGVIYTRGSFAKKPKNCFLDTEGGEDHQLNIPYDECGLIEDAEGFLTQTIVLQQDDWLIFPGDMAFTVQCKISGEEKIARIGLADPDPSAKDMAKHKKSTVEGKGSVVFTPDDIRPRRKKKNNKKAIASKEEL